MIDGVVVFVIVFSEAEYGMKIERKSRFIQ